MFFFLEYNNKTDYNTHSETQIRTDRVSYLVNEWRSVPCEIWPLGHLKQLGLTPILNVSVLTVVIVYPCQKPYFTSRNVMYDYKRRTAFRVSPEKKQGCDTWQMDMHVAGEMHLLLHLPHLGFNYHKSLCKCLNIVAAYTHVKTLVYKQDDNIRLQHKE